MRLLLSLLLLASTFVANAAPRAEKISWSDGGKTFDGYLVWDDASKSTRPGLVMIPNWYGVSDSAIAMGASASADSANPCQVRIRYGPPAANRSSASPAGRRRTSG